MKMRSIGASAVALLLALIGLTACDPPAVATMVVDSTGDQPDVIIGDGVCASTTGLCTLRAAVQEGNALATPGVVEISVPGDVTVTRTGDDAAATGDLDLTRAFRIIGSGQNTIGVHSGDRVFDVRPGGSLVVRKVFLDASSSTVGVDRGGAIRVEGGGNLAIESAIIGNGRAQQDGGAVHSDGSVVVTASTITSSKAMQGTGSAIVASATTITGSSIFANASSTAASIVTTSAAGTSQISSSLVVGSTDTDGGSTGATIVNAGSMTLADDTIARNTAPTGALAGSGSYTASNTVLASNVKDCAGPITSLGFNLESGTSCGLTGGGDLQNGAFAFDETTRLVSGNVVYFLALDGPAIESGGNCLATDIRGATRPIDSDANGTATCDRGAVEHDARPLALTVTSGVDAVDLQPGDGLCATAVGACTLRAAIQETNARGTADTISVAPGVTVELTITGAGENASAKGDLDVLGDLTITGADTGLSIVDANLIDRVFDVLAGTVTFNRLQITGGLSSDGFGGAGIRSAAGTAVTVNNSYLVDDDVASGSGGSGGGLRVEGTATINRSTVRSNFGDVSGGGMYVAGTAVVDTSTFDGNASATGVTVAVAPGGTLTVTSSTLVGKSPVSAIEQSGTTTVWNSILVNLTGPMCSAPAATLGNNMENGTSCHLIGSGDAQSANPLLAAFAANGGDTLTRMPGAGSPAIGTGVCTSATDQRGVARPQGGSCDKGAVEQP